MTYRRTMAIAPTLLGWLVHAPVTLADASFDPSVDGGVSGASEQPILPLALTLIVGLALVILVRTRGPGGTVAVLGTLAGIAIGLLFIAAGLLSDWSGRHEVYPIPILIGVVVIAAVLFLVRRRRSAQPRVR